MILSASSLITLEDVRRENPDAWYQAYLAGEPSRIEPLVDRVAAADRGGRLRAMTTLATRELAPGEWAVLGLLAEAPETAHPRL